MEEQELERWVEERFQGADEALEADDTTLLQEYAELSLDDFDDLKVFSTEQLLRLGFQQDAIDTFLTPDRHSPDDDEWENDPALLDDPTVREEPEVAYASLDNNYKTPARYYSIEGVRAAIQESPELKAWLEHTKKQREKLDRAVRDQITHALGVTIKVYDASRIIKGNTHTVKMLNLLKYTVKRWNDTYWRQIAEGKLPKLILHSDDPKMANVIDAAVVRTVRDELTDYALMHRAFLNKPGLEHTTKILRIKTAVSITKIYPKLAAAVNFVFYHPQGWSNPPVDSPSVRRSPLHQAGQPGDASPTKE